MFSSPPLAPVHFFRLHADINYRKPKFKRGDFLPDTADLLGEDHFGAVGMMWSEEGVLVHVHAHKKFETSCYPKFSQGDAVELFIDSRDLKEAGLPTRFCHHFLILPQEVQGIRAIEMTRFRSEESHPLCDPEKIEVTFREGSKEYFLDIYLPKEILHGYDPEVFDRLGFTYTLHRPQGGPQNFSVSSRFVSISQNPALWASCKLKK